MKKITALILSLVFLVTLFTSCDRDYDENEVKAAAEKLIAESVLFNDIFWGEGLPHYEDKNYSDGEYYAAIEAYYYNLGFTNIAELKAAAEKVFSTEYMSLISSTIFSEIYDGNEMVHTSRYYQRYSAADGVTPEAIMVNVNWKNLLNGEVTYDYSSLTVTHSEDEIVYVTINATVKLDDLAPKTKTIEIGLIEEEAGWRVHTPTYLNYYYN